MSLGLPVGQVDSSLALSRDHNVGGAAASIGYQYVSQRFGGSGALQWMSPQYANLSLKSAQDCAIVQAQGSLNTNIGSSTTLGLEYSYQRFRTEGTTHQVSITANTRISHRSSTSLLASLERCPITADTSTMSSSD